MAEQDGSASHARKALTRAQWGLHCTLNRIDELTALLSACFRRVAKLEAEERCALALLEAAARDADGFVDILRGGAWDDTSRRHLTPPSWWPRLPDGWRVWCWRGRLGLEHRDGRQHRFTTADELVEFIRELTSNPLPAPPLQRVRPRALRRRATGTEGDDA